MPNTTSAIRRVRRVKLQTAVNRLRKSKYKSVVKKMSNYIADNKMKEVYWLAIGYLRLNDLE